MALHNYSKYYKISGDKKYNFVVSQNQLVSHLLISFYIAWNYFYKEESELKQEKKIVWTE